MTNRAVADFFLDIEGVDYPFFLARENGLRLWGDGFAPMLAPQVRTTGFGYEHVPPEYEVVEPFEDFTGGAGFTRAIPTRNGYHYARGIDFSWEREACLALKRRTTLESDGTAVAAAPVKFYYSSLGLFALAGAYIYEWQLGTTDWIERDDATGTFSGVAYTDIIELDGVLMACRGTTADYKTSTDGITWTAFTAENENADVFTARGNGSDVAAIWKVNDNLIKVNTAPVGAGWTGSDEVGHTSETTHSALTVDNDIYVFKNTGIYTYDGTNAQDMWKTDYLAAQNGRNAFLWSNREAYVPYGEELLEFNPYGDTTLTPIYPAPGMDSAELLGLTTAVGGDNNRLYTAIKNSAGNTYLMKGRYVEALKRWAWHPIAYLGANDCNCLLLVQPGIMHATNPAVVFGYGTAINYIVLPRGRIHPSDDSACTFESSGEAWGSWSEIGARTFPKFLSRGEILARGVYPSRKIELHYNIDYKTDHYDLLSTLVDGLSEQVEREDREFNDIRYDLHMTTDSASLTPVLDAIAFACTLNPRRKRTWEPTVVLADSLSGFGGGDMDIFPSADTTRLALQGAMRKQLTLTERGGAKFTVRLLDMKSAGVTKENLGDTETDALAYRLSMVEIAEQEAS